MRTHLVAAKTSTTAYIGRWAGMPRADAPMSSPLIMMCMSAWPRPLGTYSTPMRLLRAVGGRAWLLYRSSRMWLKRPGRLRPTNFSLGMRKSPMCSLTLLPLSLTPLPLGRYLLGDLVVVAAKIQLSPSSIMSGSEYSGTTSRPAGSWAVSPTRRKISPGFSGKLAEAQPVGKALHAGGLRAGVVQLQVGPVDRVELQEP
ncbi:LOW QUALITY PROTEIN: hypothetical protein CRUP_030563, partial [Coryphaenoides rupestris]